MRLHKVFLILGVFILGVLAFVSVRNPRVPDSSTLESSRRNLSGRQIALSASRFIRILPFDLGSIAWWQECNEERQCHFINSENPVGTAAWRIQAFSKLYLATKNKSFLTEAKEAYAFLQREFRQSRDVDINLRQLYDGYLATKDIGILNNIVGWGNYLLIDQTIFKANKDPTWRGVMLSSLIIAEWADIASILRDAKTRELLASVSPNRALSSEMLEKQRDKFIGEAYRLLGSTKEKERASSLSLLTGSDGISDNSCWLQLAKYSLYTATNDPTYKEELDSYFGAASFLSRDVRDIKIPAMQKILPCAEVAKNLGTEDAKYLPIFHHIMEKLILPGWDGPERPICMGNGGLNSIIQSFKKKNCTSSEKYIPDTAWLIALLADSKQVFKLEDY
ncbi:MAG: hypothetical protein GYA55_04570 [SAR324 cluster bacterium]|uniref:Uncharacterized protein n=1 Tax=SAR324 cluster bacterium TaxID=2024889 RepID=A0A7X9FQP2_9DELT|nr:hypothetical protein [SAR324 cluster bacterium]